MQTYPRTEWRGFVGVLTEEVMVQILCCRKGHMGVKPIVCHEPMHTHSEHAQTATKYIHCVYMQSIYR